MTFTSPCVVALLAAPVLGERVGPRRWAAVQLLGAAVTGYLIFDDVPDAWLWAGATLIIGSGLLVAHVERRGAPR